jgi:uncharacterized protein with FMN-binding domain
MFPTLSEHSNAKGKLKALKNKFTIFSHFVFIACLHLTIAGCQIAPIIGSRIEGNKLRDGVYEGFYRKGLNKAVVKVTIAGGRIVDVECIEHFASWKGKKAEEVIPKRIVAEESTRVDAVTGATNSSRVIMNAVQRAIQKAY